MVSKKEHLFTMSFGSPKHPINTTEPTSGTKGYTLIELTVVIFLVSLMLGVSIPRVRSSLLTDSLKSTTRKIVGLLKGIRDEATREHKAYIVHFDLERNRVWVTSAGMGEEEKVLARERAFTCPSDVRIMDVWRTGKGKSIDGVVTIQFSKKGYTEQTAIHLVAEDGRRFTLVISPFLGTVKSYNEYRDIENI